MKKFLLIVNLLLISAGLTFAQTTPAKAKDAKTKPATTSTTKPATASTTKPAANSAGPTKKDGTPDMR